MIKVNESHAEISGEYDTILTEFFTLILKLRNVNVRVTDIFNVFIAGMIANLNAYRPDVTPEEWNKEEERLLAMSLEDIKSVLSKLMEAERNMQ